MKSSSHSSSHAGRWCARARARRALRVKLLRQMTIRAKTRCQLILFNVYSVRDMAEQNKVLRPARARMHR